MWFGRVKHLVFIQPDDAKAQVNGVKGAKYQSFKTQWAAEEAFRVGPDSFQDLRVQVVPDIIENSIAVDAAFGGNPGIVEYQGVYTGTGTPYFIKKLMG